MLTRKAKIEEIFDIPHRPMKLSGEIYMGKINEMTDFLRQDLLARQSPGSLWRGALSASAISTSTSVFALSVIDRDRYAAYVEAGVKWLRATMLPDGCWGDTPESKANMTATLLSYATLFYLNAAPEETKTYLSKQFGDIGDEHIVNGVLKYYGKDLTFSLPILVMCASAGVITRWDAIPHLPFELSALPQRVFRFLNLPVVSYAIPALIAVGILRHRKGKRTIFYPLRDAFVKKSLKVLTQLQPVNGGFLEAAPLTAFVSMCMACAGYKEHPVTRKAAGFLINTVRENGAWPIDTDLAGWLTALSVKALGPEIPDRERLLETIAGNTFTFKHPFTGAQPGGWGWSDLPGAAPDADDTAGSLIAMHVLRKDSRYIPEVSKGIEWLLDLQNRDGGMPTFCKGWSRLPFDRSSPDISAHSLAAFELWCDMLPCKLQQRCRKSIHRLLRWLEKTQAADGSWTPLWFGDQDAADEKSPVYGAAVTVEYLSMSRHPLAAYPAKKGVAYLLSVQNDDGGWGGAKDLPSKVTFTARALSALSQAADLVADNVSADHVADNVDRALSHAAEICDDAIVKGIDFLYRRFKDGTLNNAEPVGLYFARLWYSEELYNITFALNALKQIRNRMITNNN
ncbi:MAG: squalene--hopene cyclase [Tannerella sp.]|jgi:squalene-hopene/tetraprenyl-beta-curcumene cyclase|nr:squalene--hopene cyclase [Tannerella sp.]